MDAEQSEGSSGRRRRALSLIAIAAVVVVASSIAYLSPRLASKASPGLPSISPGLVTESGDYFTFAFLTPSLGWALDVSTDAEGIQYRVYRTSDGARNWQLQLKGQFGGVLRTPPSIRFFDQTHGFIATGYTLYRTVDGGAHWVPTALPDAEAGFIDFSDSRHGWFLGSEPDNPDLAHHLFATGDAGGSWRQLPDPPIGGIGMTFRSPSEGWLWTIGPDQPHLYVSIDGGQSWQTLDTPQIPGQLPGENTFVATLRLLPRYGAVAYLALSQDRGFSLPLYEFTSFDLGASWRHVPLRPNQTDNPEGFEDAFNWWAIDSESVYKSSDAGQTWSKVSAVKVSAHIGQSFGYFVFPLDSKHAWAQVLMGDGIGLAVTNDGGLTWTRVKVPQPA